MSGVQMNQSVKPSVLRHLIEIFKAVADHCDGGDDALLGVKDAYYDALDDLDVKEFYGRLVDERSEEVFGKYA